MARSSCLVALLFSVLVAFSTCAPHNNKDARKVESEDPLEPIADSQQIYPSFAAVPFPPLHRQQPLAQRQAREEVGELTPDSQHYFPSFSSIFSNHPLGHSRPPVYDDPPSSHRPRHIPYALQQANSFDAFATNNDKAKNSFASSSPSTTSKEQTGANSNQDVLGSGNFGVIRGGTFYEDDYDQGSTNDDFFYYGGGRPSYSYNYRPPQQSASTNGDDFFANFRDFADITAPKQPQQGAYSELHVVYANKNGTLRDAQAGPPRNIFEQLEQLEQLEEQPKPKYVKAKKLSKGKAKLAKHQQKEASKLEWKKLSFQQSPKDLYQEPLLALS